MPAQYIASPILYENYVIIINEIYYALEKKEKEDKDVSNKDAGFIDKDKEKYKDLLINKKTSLTEKDIDLIEKYRKLLKIILGDIDYDKLCNSLQIFKDLVIDKLNRLRQNSYNEHMKNIDTLSKICKIV